MSEIEAMVDEIAQQFSTCFPQLKIDPAELKRKTMRLFNSLWEMKSFRNGPKIRIALAALYFETRKHVPHDYFPSKSDPRVLENFCQFIRQRFRTKYRRLPNKKTLSRAYRAVVKSQWVNFPTLVREICQNMQLSKELSDKAVNLARRIKEKGIEPRRDLFYLVAGCIYDAGRLLGLTGKKRITQNKLANQFNTSGSTIKMAADYLVAELNLTIPPK